MLLLLYAIYLEPLNAQKLSVVFNSVQGRSLVKFVGGLDLGVSTEFGHFFTHFRLTVKYVFWGIESANHPNTSMIL